MTQSAPELTLYELLSPDLRYLKYEKLLLYKKFRIYQKVSEKRNFTDLDIPHRGWRLALNLSFVVFIFFFQIRGRFLSLKTYDCILLSQTTDFDNFDWPFGRSISKA